MHIQLIDNSPQGELISYKDSLAEQTALFRQAVEAKCHSTHPLQHHLIFNQHRPVLTLGKHADTHNILITPQLLQARGIDCYQIERGGDVTYHGPGQWTIYPIFDLEELGIGLRRYVELLEEVAIQVADKFGVHGIRIQGASGVWVDPQHPRKICAIGIQASHYITMHGIAFNVTTPPEAFSIINPCGFSDRGVTNLSIEAGQEITMEQAKHLLIQSFQDLFQREIRY